MYALSKSLLESAYEYRVEVYDMEVFGYDDVLVEIDLKIIGEPGYETYIGHYLITTDDGKTAEGTCVNRPTKEDTLLAVEKAVIKQLDANLNR